MKHSAKKTIDYIFNNWGKIEKIVCEQDLHKDGAFLLLKEGQNVGTITRVENAWQFSLNSIFLPSDAAKIGDYIEKHLAVNTKKR
ncbi:hypothetical protein ACVWYG_003332 [Pedobacter sp. UYEF25]